MPPKKRPDYDIRKDAEHLIQTAGFVHATVIHARDVFADRIYAIIPPHRAVTYFLVKERTEKSEHWTVEEEEGWVVD